MRWEGRRQSENVVDRRGVRTAGVIGAGSIVLAIFYFLLTGDPSAILNIQPPSSQVGASGERSEAENRLAGFVGVVLADTEDVWKTLLEARGVRYSEPKLVLFTGHVASTCGMASSAVGPFYCPQDRKVYLDLGFFDALDRKLGASGDFAQAYVIAHEVAHHVQNLLGLMQPQRGSSVALELQADCLAGVWAMHTEKTKNVLEKGDLEEALGAAAAIGDDRLQMQSQGYVVPDSFTHGSSKQRVSAFAIGFRRGEMADCGI